MRKSVLIRLAWYVFSLFLFWNALVAVRAWRFTHFSDRPPMPQVHTAGFLSDFTRRFAGPEYIKSANTEKPAAAYQTVYLFTGNGLRIECWYMPVAQSRGTVALFHGLLGSKQNMLAEANGLRQMGYNVLLPDFRAHGGSEGLHCALGMDETEEVKMCFEYIRGRGETNIVLYGSSMGAATISHAISRYGISPQKVVLDMPFGSYEQLVENWFKKSKYPKQPTAALFTFWAGVLNNKWMFAHKPSQYVKAINCPVLMQWGRQDELIPESATLRIYNNITAPKQLAVYEKTGHSSFCKNEPVLWENALRQFLLQ